MTVLCIPTQGEHYEEAVKLYSLYYPSAKGVVDQHLENWPAYKNQGVGLYYNLQAYPNCCGLTTLSAVSVTYLLAPEVYCITLSSAKEACNRLMAEVASAGGGGCLVADRADGSGIMINILKKLNWASKEITLEPSISLNNPMHNSDVGLWFLRKKNGQVRRKLEEMK